MKTFTLNFYLRPSKIRKDGTAPLYARITIDKKRTEFAIKRWIEPANWDEKKNKAIGKKTLAKELNDYIASIRSQVYQHHRSLLEKGETPTAILLKEKLFGIDQHKGKSLIEVFEYHNQKMRELVGIDYAAGTLVRFETVLNHLKSFLNLEYQKEDILLKHLKYAFITDFDHFLRTKRKIGNNTVVKYMALFRKIILLSIENDWLAHNPFKRYKAKAKIVEREFLDREELARLQEKDLHTERLKVVRDIFVFSCFTGLAYADVTKLTADNLALGVDGERWINVNRTKTDSKSLIPLLPPALRLIEKYADHIEVEIKGTLFPIRSNQKMNAYLKEIASICGIQKRLTFHTARHTFATTVTLSNGVPIESVSAMLGHKDIKTTQHYAKIVQRKVSEDMQTLKGKLFGEASTEPKKIRKLS